MKTSDFITQKIRDLFERYKASGGTQSSLARACGANQSQVSVWLKGGYLPSAEVLPGLAKAFGVPIAEFFPPDEAKAASPPATGLTGVKRELFDLIAGLDEPKARGLLRLIRRTLELTQGIENLQEPQVLSKKPRR